MKIKNIGLLSIVLVVLINFSCSTSTSSSKKRDNITNEETNSDITLTKAPPSPEFSDAYLAKSGVTIDTIDSAFVVNYTFDVDNYDLGVPTEDYDIRGIANSGKGQHIHFIVNNGPYSAHYMSGMNQSLEAGNYVVLAFLSRSYHESVKSPNAYYIENLVVGDVAPDSIDITAPHLFYSRPKGIYSGEDTKKIMLDFYLLNTTISPDGNKVKATINGNEFTIDEWVPYYIENLPMGENEIRLELIDIYGNTVSGPYNAVERSVTLEE